MKYRILGLFLTLQLTVFAQNVPRYVLIEHFTNTWCPICASKNPAFQDLLKKYPKDVHHVSIHPPYPYSGCPLYQYNKSHNQDRATFYKVQGSPTIVVNGGSPSGGSPLLTEDALKNEIKKLSPLSVIVTEKGSGNNRSASIIVKSSAAINGDLRLVVLLAERNLRFTSSNGELDHYNVMRKYLTPVTGQKITITSASEQKFDFIYKDSLGWKPEEIYVLAFVQNGSTGEVYNSGTKFDQTTTALHVKIPTTSLRVFPTLAVDVVYVDMPDTRALYYEVYNSHGQLVQNNRITKTSRQSVSIADFAPGVYWLRIKDQNKLYTAKFIKQ